MTETTQVILIGIAGPSGSGKSTYARHLVDYCHSPLTPIMLDHFFTHSVSIDHPILGQIESWEPLECLNIDGFFNLLKQLKTSPMISTDYHRKDININVNQSIIIIVEGYLLFVLSDQITNLFDIKIFFNSSLNECRLRRFRRRHKISDDISDENVSISNEFQQWFDHLVWNEYLKYRDQQIQHADQIFSSNDYEQLDNYIFERLNNIRRKSASNY